MCDINVVQPFSTFAQFWWAFIIYINICWTYLYICIWVKLTQIDQLLQKLGIPTGGSRWTLTFPFPEKYKRNQKFHNFDGYLDISNRFVTEFLQSWVKIIKRTYINIYCILSKYRNIACRNLCFYSKLANLLWSNINF